MHSGFDDLLLEEEEGSLMVHLRVRMPQYTHLLAQLHNGFAGVLDRLHNAVFACFGLDDKGDDEGLLENHVKHFLLHGDVEFDTA